MPKIIREGNKVFVDGKLLKLSESPFAEFEIIDEESFKLLNRCELSDIQAAFTSLSIHNSDVFLDDRSKLYLNEFLNPFDIMIFSLNFSTNISCKALFVIKYDLENWKFTWSLNELLKELDESTKSLDRVYFENINLTEIDGSIYKFWATIKYHDEVTNIISELSKCISDIHKSAAGKCYSKKTPTQYSSYSMLEVFDFPEDIKIACVQYLQYFAEFLKDVGIKAEVALTPKDSGEFLFSVMPKNKDEALDNIREALNVYLRLPNSNIDADMSDLAVQSLNAQIFHFKGQLTLAAATIQQQQSTIQNLQLKPISPDVLVLSQQGNEKDEEPLLGGIIKVGEAELAEGALSINLAALLRWLKEKFRKTKSKPG